MLQFATEPRVMSLVQPFPSLHSSGQLPSQVSPGSMIPLPQCAGQSSSLVASHDEGQQSSSSAHPVIS